MSARGKLVIVAGVLFDATADAVWDKAETLLWSRPDARLHFCHVVGRAAIVAEGQDETPSLVDDALKRLHAWVAEKAGGEATPLGMLSPHRIHPTWRNFLDVAYWNVELS